MLLITLLIRTAKPIFKTTDEDEDDVKDNWFIFFLIKIGVILLLLLTSYFGVSKGFKDVEKYILNINALKTYKNELVIYEEENAKIAKEIELIVNNYIAHEENVVNKVSSRNPLFLAENYPELKSSELVKTQLKVYKSNAEEIKKSKVRLSQENQWRWLLYFGGEK